MATLQTGQKLDRKAAQREAEAKAPEPVFTRTYATAREYIAGMTTKAIRETYPAYMREHGEAAFAKYMTAIEAAIVERAEAKAAREAEATKAA